MTAPIRTFLERATARRLHPCDVQDGRITAVTTSCNGGWDDELRAGHSAETSRIRP